MSQYRGVGSSHVVALALTRSYLWNSRTSSGDRRQCFCVMLVCGMAEVHIPEEPHGVGKEHLKCRWDNFEVDKLS